MPATQDPLRGPAKALLNLDHPFSNRARAFSSFFTGDVDLSEHGRVGGDECQNGNRSGDRRTSAAPIRSAVSPSSCQWAIPVKLASPPSRGLQRALRRRASCQPSARAGLGQRPVPCLRGLQDARASRSSAYARARVRNSAYKARQPNLARASRACRAASRRQRRRCARDERAGCRDWGDDACSDLVQNNGAPRALTHSPARWPVRSQ